MEVILKNVTDKHIKLIKSLAETLELEVVVNDRAQGNSDFVNHISNTKDVVGKGGKDIKMTIDEIDKLWE